MKFTKTFIGLFLSIGLLSCSNDNDEIPEIKPSTNLIEMEAEGGETEVLFTSGDWSIVEVINTSGNVNINGNIYSENGTIIQENKTLALKGQGKMVAEWDDKGFVISRETSTSLKIELMENSTEEDFNFTIVLNSGQEFKKINVIQKKSQGYKFDSIEFALKENDGDSLFVKKGTNHKITVEKYTEFTFSPYDGINIEKQSHFESKEKDAFVWLQNESVLVKIPSRIDNNEIYFDGEKSLYSTSLMTTPHGFEKMETLTLPAGQSTFSTEIEFRRRKVSYKIVLINNRTSDKKIIEGKWIEIAPTGAYSIVW